MRRVRWVVLAVMLCWPHGVLAEGTPAPDPALVPASACAGGDDWIFTWDERTRTVRDELDASIAAHGDGVDNEIGPILRAFVTDLRASNPPPALVARMILVAWQTADLAEAMEEIARGRPPAYDEARAWRDAEYQDRTFEAYAMICDTSYQWLGPGVVFGTPVPTPTPRPVRTEPVRRDEVCGPEWFMGLLERYVAAGMAAEQAGDNPAKQGKIFADYAEAERASDPPAAWVGLSVLYTFAADEQVAHWASPDRYPALSEAETAQLASDLGALGEAYHAICDPPAGA
jgi:hypothetical protein